MQRLLKDEIPMYVILLFFFKIKAQEASTSSGLHPVKPPNDVYSEFCENLSVFLEWFGKYCQFGKAFFRLLVYTHFIF